jgi:O-antigen/teichoic acid export membrane protein
MPDADAAPRSPEGAEGGAQKNLGRRAVRGVATTGLAQLARVLLQVGSVVILARLLSPRDYGLVAMVLVVIGIAEVLRDMGLSAAAIQAETLSPQQRDNLFWVNTGAGALLALLVALSAPLLAVLYGHAEVLQITLVLAPSFLLSGLATQYRASLVREMRFGLLAAAEVTGSLIGLSAGIVMAFADFGYWALVGQQLTGGVVALILLLGVSRWLPGAYRRDVDIRPLLKVGGSVLGSQLLTFASYNADSFLVGARFGATDLGLYNRAIQLVRTPISMVRAPIGTVSLPVLSRLQNDPVRYMAFAERGQLVVAYPMLAGIGWVVACGPQFVSVALGDQWLPATNVIRLIALGEGLSTLMFVASSMYLSLGLARELMRFSLFTTIFRLLLLVCAVPWGVTGVASAYVIGPLLVFPCVLWQVGRATGLPTWRLFRQGVEVVASVTIATLVTWYAVSRLEALPPALILLLAGAVHLAVLAALAVHPAVRRQFKEALQVVMLMRRAPDMLSPHASMSEKTAKAYPASEGEGS